VSPSETLVTFARPPIVTGVGDGSVPLFASWFLSFAPQQCAVPSPSAAQVVKFLRRDRDDVRQRHRHRSAVARHAAVAELTGVVVAPACIE